MPDPHAATWTTVVLTVAPDEAELAADLLFQAGAAAVEEQADGSDVVLLGGFDDPDAARAAAAGATERSLGTVVVRPVTDDGLDAWRPFARCERAGRWWLVPAWLPTPAEADEADVLRLDPGHTFGSGSHPTTRLVAAQLGDLVGAGDTVLDVGCGSGVLAVVAARLGAAAVIGVDVDPEAPAATRANAEANGVGDRIRASTATVAEVLADHGPFAVVAANLLAPVVAELATDLVAAVGPGGHLVVSGLLADRWGATTDLLAPLAVRSVATDDGWASVVLAAPPATGEDHAPDSGP